MSRLLERARDLMAKPGAWLSAEGGALRSVNVFIGFLHPERCHAVLD